MKKITNAILILIILISLGVIAYLSLIKKTLPTIIQPTVSPTIPTPTPTIDISGWKTYADSKSAYEYKYPKDYSGEVNIKIITLINTAYVGDQAIFQAPDGRQFFPPYECVTTENFEKDVYYQNGRLTLWRGEKIKVNDNIYCEFEKSVFVDDNYYDIYYRYEIIKNNKLYTINFNPLRLYSCSKYYQYTEDDSFVQSPSYKRCVYLKMLDDQKKISLNKKILSTFKFINK